MKKRLIAAAIASLLAGGSAYAVTANQTAPATQDAPPPPGRGPGGMLMMADTNKDGIVTRDEFMAGVDARFARADANKDGKLTADERKGPGQGQGGRRGGRIGKRMAAKVDANGDGAVTLDEQRAQAAKTFAYIDRNNDGKVDKAEMAQLRDTMAALGPKPGGHGGKHGRRGPPPPPVPNTPADAPNATPGE